MIPLILNWFGIAVHDVAAATEFYCEKLGFASVEHDATDSWRYFETQRMTFELFKAHPDRVEASTWGDGQAFRPLILVGDLSATASMLEGMGISITHENSDWGLQIEMSGPEGIRWGLGEDTKLETGWIHPVIGGIELRAANLDAQKAFYTNILGMTVHQETDRGVHLFQSNGDAWLRILRGGKPVRGPIDSHPESRAFFHPIWVSFETTDVKSANEWLLHQSVAMLRPLTYHEDWKGTDILLADPDGNVVQVVQYG